MFVYADRCTVPAGGLEAQRDVWRGGRWWVVRGALDEALWCLSVLGSESARDYREQNSQTECVFLC